MTERRRTIRLPDYDYASTGAYFVTVCSHGGRRVFDAPETRSLVEETWRRIPDHFPNARTDELVVMPNHVHGIVWILGDGVSDERSLAGPRGVGAPSDGQSDRRGMARQRMVGARHASPLRNDQGRATGASAGSLGAIIGSFKAAAARRINQAMGTPGGRIWQRNYYERVVRDEKELQRAREYIAFNPLKWQLDSENPDRTADPAYSREWSWLEGAVRP